MSMINAIKNRIIYFFLLVGLQGNAAVHIIGDSCSGEFRGYGCSIHYLGPITMYRIERDKLNVIDFRKMEISEEDTVVLAFGEIDVRGHINKPIE